MNKQKAVRRLKVALNHDPEGMGKNAVRDLAMSVS